MISIHAPSRERLDGAKNNQRELQFQSTLPRGSDTPTNRMPSFLAIFQSTLPRGSDRYRRCRACVGADFNPRSLAGATWGVHRRSPAGAISIHAPSRERRRCRIRWRLAGISIHAPSRERRNNIKKTYAPLQFQSTLPRGSDRIGRK